MDISYYKKYEPINGKWFLTKEIGRGAYGVVFEAERRDMIKGKSAIKVISIPSSQNDVESYRQEHYDLDEQSVTSYFYGFVEEILKEIKIMALFQGHKNIVRIEDYEVREREGETGWDIFIRMELLTPLNQYLANNSFSEKDIIKLGCDICIALEECEKHNIIHRDIKPSNIFVSSTGNFKLGDFGVARTLEKTSSGLSKKGTYTYMAPEVYKGDAYSSNIDIYSLGIVMYKLLNNNFEPFRTENSFTDEEKALMRRMKGESFEKPVNASSQLSEIILKACEYDSKKRYNHPFQVRSDLEKINAEPKNISNSVVENSQEEILRDAGTVGLFGACKDVNLNNMEEVMKTDAVENLHTEKSKSRIIFLLLALFPYTGLFGVHDFYLGNKKSGIIKLCTLNFLCFGWIADVVLIIANKYKPINQLRSVTVKENEE